MSNYDRRDENYEIMQQRARAQRTRDQTFSMLGTAGLYNRRPRVRQLPQRSELDIQRQKQLEDLQRQQIMDQVKLQQQFQEQEMREKSLQEQQRNRRMNGMAVLQSHDSKLSELETKIDNILANMGKADNIFTNVEKKNKLDYSNLEAKLSDIEKKIATGSFSSEGGNSNNVDFEKFMTKQLDDLKKNVDQQIIHLNGKVENLPSSSGTVSGDTGNVSELLAAHETKIIEMTNRMEKTINKNVVDEINKKFQYIESKFQEIEQKILQSTAAAQSGGGRGGGASMGMINRIRDELTERINAMERHGGGGGPGMGKSGEKFLQQQRLKLDKAASQLKELQSAYRTREMEVDFMFNKVKELHGKLYQRLNRVDEKLFPEDKKDEKSQQNVQLTVSE